MAIPSYSNLSPFHKTDLLSEELRKLRGMAPQAQAADAVTSEAVTDVDVTKPDLAGVGIQAGASVIGGLLAMKAAKKKQQDQMEFDAENMKFKNLANASEYLSEGQRQAMMRLIANMRGATQ